MDRNEADLEFVDAPISVRYAETDKMGVVYHANYLVWFEVGRGAWCKSKGFRYAEMELNDKRYMMVAEASCRYKSPAHFEDEIVVRTAVTKSTDRIIRYCYEIRESKTWKLLATGVTAHVVTDFNCKPARLPAHYRELFSIKK
jgi:acyl-CoA thioester hydrolase